MPVRVFGANKGPGTQLREVTPAKPIQAGAYGSTAMVGIFRSGPVGTLQTLEGGLPQFTRIYGGLTQDGDAPLAAQHFYEVGVGAGVLYVVRVTDGSEVAADLDLYSRDVDRGILERAEAAKPPSPIMTLAAKNGGRWGGRRDRRAGDITLSTAISGATVDLAFATLTDKWVGAVITFPNDDSAAEYTVTGNTDAGVFTIAGSFTAATIAGTDGRYLLELSNVHELTGRPEYLAVVAGNGGEGDTTFTLGAVRDGASVKSWENVTLDASGRRYWYDQISTDRIDNFEITPTDSFTGDATDPYQRPANFAEIPAPGGVDANVITFQVIRWSTAGTGNPYLDTVNDVTWGSAPVPCTIVLTFTTATDYTVAVTLQDGGIVAGLPAGVAGTAYTAQHAWLPGWTVRAGTVAAIAGTTMTIYVRVLPESLKDRGAWFFISAGPDDGDQNVRYKVVDNDHESVTLAANVLLDDVVTEPGAPTLTGATAGPFDLSPANLTFIYTVGGTGPYTLTEALAGAATTTTATVAELNAKELARAGSAAAKLVQFSVSTDDKVKVTALQDFGEIATLVLGAGTLNAVLGFTTAQSATGDSPSICRLEWRQEMGGGYDGIADIDADDYAQVWDVGSSVFNDLLARNTGVIRLCMPAITDADAQAAMMQYAYETNAVAFCTIPDTITTEAAAVAWHRANLAIGAPQDYHCAPFPSYALIRSPYGSGLYTAPAVGLILGLTAKRAVELEGYHNAPAGTTYLISPIAKDLPTHDTVLNGEILNGYGLIELRKRGPQIYLFGDRIPGDGERGWLHKRLTNSQIGRTLLTGTEALAFSSINDATFSNVKRLLIQLFTPWHRRGWFRDSDGPALADQVSFKVDASNNPVTERELGNLHADVGFTVVDTAERVIFQIGPRGVSAP